MAKLKTFPQTLKDGSSSVKIYKTPVNGYEAFTVTWYEGGKRRRIVRSDYNQIRKEADDVLRQLNLGITPSRQLRGEDRESYLAAILKMKPLGISLNEAIKDYASASAALGDRATLSDAVRFFCSHAPELADADKDSLFHPFRNPRTGRPGIEGVR